MIIASITSNVSWNENPFILLATLLIVGVASQWIAWRIRLPSILVLLLVGFLLGPVMGILDPDDLFGKLLFPFVSLSVALILYEGGMSLSFRELRGVGASIRNLVTIGVLITWILTSLAAIFILRLQLQISLLLGAILVVTGPTVIIPLLHHIQPQRRVASLLKWEGIIIDPVGAILAVLVFEFIRVDAQSINMEVVFWLGKALFVGVLLGIAGGGIVWFCLKRYWIPDSLQNPFSLMVLFGMFSVANVIQPESGLLTATVMGVTLTNQRSVDIRHIMEFKANLRTLLTSVLFILLAARVEIDALWPIPLKMVVFVLILIVVIRPTTVWLSTIGKGLSSKEKWFLSWMAPRGIVAAAVASVFALDLELVEMNDAHALVPITFSVIIGTVLVYGLTSGKLASSLRLSQSDPQGIIMIGAHEWARNLAVTLKNEGIHIILLDINRSNIYKASIMGLEAHCGNVLSENFFEELDLSGIGYLLAITSNDEVNSLAALRREHLLETSKVYQLQSDHGENLSGKDCLSHGICGRILFASDATFSNINERIRAGYVFKTINIKDFRDYEKFNEIFGKTALPMFVLDSVGRVTVLTEGQDISIKPDNKLISLVNETSALLER